MGFLSDLIGGKNKTVPTSSSTSQSTQSSRSGSVSSGSSQAFGSSLASSISSVFEADAFSDLFASARDATSRAQAFAPGLRETAGRLFSSGAGFLEQLSGESAVDRRLADSGVEDEQISALGSDLGRFFSEEINPRIASRGIAAGQFGGSRGEVAQGTAARSLAEEFVRGSTAIRAAGVERRDRLAVQSDATGSARAGQALEAIPSLFGLAEAGAGAELGPLIQLAQILGPRTVLSASTSESSSSSFASQLARAFGESQGQSTSSSQGSQVVKGPGLLDIVNSAAGFFPG